MHAKPAEYVCSACEICISPDAWELAEPAGDVSAYVPGEKVREKVTTYRITCLGSVQSALNMAYYYGEQGRKRRVLCQRISDDSLLSLSQVSADQTGAEGARGGGAVRASLFLTIHH